MTMELSDRNIKILAEDYLENKSSYDVLNRKNLERLCSIQFSKGRYYYLYPFQNELGGFSKGRLLKSEPSKFKNVYEYGFDEDGKIISIVEHVTDSISNKSFVERHCNEERVYTYVGGTRRLRNVLQISHSDDHLVSEVLNWGEYGWYKDVFNYVDDGRLTKIEKIACEHDKTTPTVSTICFSYNGNTLSSIIQHFSNGYEQKLY